MWFRTKSLIEIAYFRYVYKQTKLSLQDIEALVLFERGLNDFSQANDELVSKAQEILHSVVSEIRQYWRKKERISNFADLDEMNLTAQAMCGEEKPLKKPLDFTKFREAFSNETEMLLRGLDAEFRVLKIELEVYRQSPLVYKRLYQKSCPYFEYNRNELDPDGSISRSLYSRCDWDILAQEKFFSLYSDLVAIARQGDLYKICLCIALNCDDVYLLDDFLYPEQKRGRKKSRSLHGLINDELQKLATQGLIAMPPKKSVIEVLKKLRSDKRVKAHYERLIVPALPPSEIRLSS